MSVTSEQDQSLERRSIIVGQVFASRSPAVVSTVLGSCIAACLYDSALSIGGMNHFMLPESNRGATSASFGIHAMELLINQIMQLGGDRRRLQAKIFGGANVLALQGQQLQIGMRNVKFIREFLADEGIPITAHRLGGSSGVKLCFFTHTAKALVRPLSNSALNETLTSETQYLRQSPVSSAHEAEAVQIFS